MASKNTVRSNKTVIEGILCADHRLILSKVHEKALITGREYNNLKSINKEDVEGHVVALVDKIMFKGDDTCQAFLNLLQTDEEIKSTYPELRNVQWGDAGPLRAPLQVSATEDSADLPPDNKRRKEDEQYQLNSQPTGLCMIINNENFTKMKRRHGTDRDAESLAEVFSWLGFRALMCKDQTKDQMDSVLNCLASPGDLPQLQKFNVKEWKGSRFVDLQEAPRHGDAFVCCVLSHGDKGVVFGIDGEPLCIKRIYRTFKATNESSLTGKPKVFLIQACQSPRQRQRGVLLKDLESDDSQVLYIPEEADVLVACSTVEDYVSFRHPGEGSWFIQSVCKQLKEGCPSGDDVVAILHRVNSEVSLKEASWMPGREKQMPEVKFTLRKKLVLSPHQN